MDTKKLRQKILDLAIRGKLVPQDPNDEPASVLLERIRAEKVRLIAEGKIKRPRKSKTSASPSHYQQFEPPFEIPDSWEWVRLGEISTYGDCPNVAFSAIGDDEWVLELEDIEKDSAKLIQILTKKDRDIKGVRHKFNKGDVLYSKLRTYLNKVLVAPNNGYCSTEIIPFNTFCNISTNYLAHVLRSVYFLNYTQSCGYGVKMPRLSTNDACKGMIPLPPVEEQYRIVVTIETLFSILDIIEEKTAYLFSNIKILKSKILELAMQGKLVSQNSSDEPAAEMLKRINPNAKIITDNPHSRNIPSNWVLCRFGDIASISRGASPRPIKSYITNDPNGVNWIKIGDTDGKYINSTKEKIIREGVNLSREVKKGDFLLTNSMSFGKPYILNIDGCIHDGWLVISPKEESYDKEFLYYLLSSQYAYSQFSDKAGGAVVSNLNSAKVANTSFPLLSILEQKRIVAKIEELYACLDKIETSLQS